jgi:hypothetical protein
VSSRIKITFKNGGDYFYLEPFTPEKLPAFFDCAIAEYNEYLLHDALRSMNDHIALT